MDNINSVPTPVSTIILEIDKDGDKFVEDWLYAAVVEMPMYLAQTLDLI